MIDKVVPNESVSRLEKMIDEFDQNLKIVDFFIETENFYDFEITGKNVKKMTNLLADSSRILANIHAIRFEFTTEYQLSIYERIKKRFDLFEIKREKVHELQEKLLEHLNYKQDLMTRAQNIVSSNKVVNFNQDKYNLKILQKSDVIDVNLKTDFNEKLLEEVGANLREIDRNVNETSVSLKGQGDSLKQITQIVEGTENNINRAGKIITSLSWGQRIQLILLNLIAILLFFAIVILVILRLINSK